MQTKRKLLNSQEAAEYLGLSLSYFRKMMMRRVIPMYKPSGKLCFFDPDDLDAYLTSIRISSQSEIDSEAERYLRTTENHINNLSYGNRHTKQHNGQEARDHRRIKIKRSQGH